MKAGIGSPVWISTERGPTRATIIAIEGPIDDRHIILRTDEAKTYFRSQEDLHPDELGATEAHIHEERFWEREHRKQADTCRSNADRLERRLVLLLAKSRPAALVR